MFMEVFLGVALGMFVAQWMGDITHVLAVRFLSKRVNKAAKAQLLEFYQNAKEAEERKSGRL